jgi:predicted ATPase/class 3 adenylate cyclase
MLTDLEGSTRTWETQASAMREAMVLHDAIVYGAVERHSGAMVESGREGDSVLAAFVTAKDAAACALEIQRGFQEASWPGGLVLRTRVALHTGEVELRGGHYFGPPLNRCARVLALSHGGQILATQATYELLIEDPPHGVELTDLGVHRLKDLKRSERVFQLTDLARPVRFPPLHAKSEYRTNLAIPLTSFVGRDRELADLRGLLSRTRLLTVTGPGGVGKTRLAKQLALAAAADSAGGAWFVDLAGVSDPGLVARTVAGALDLEEQQGRALTETLAERLGDRPTLLLLDNCEHLLMACAELAESLLASCRDLRIVATSREPLNIGGEVTWRVPALALPEATRLFVERARSRQAGFDENERNAAAVAAICERLDGMPLAIELAAARASMMPPEEILRRLEGGLSVLAGGDRTAARRQRTLEATIDWSYELLEEAERLLLRRLAVFSGTFSLEAAERVGEGPGLPQDAILDHLAQLVAKSLVQPLDDRYRLLGTIRTYAREKLEAGSDRERVQQVHASYFRSVVDSRRPGSLAAWLDRVEEDHDNIGFAMSWCLANDTEMAAAIASGMYEFWLGRGYALEARTFLGQLAEQLAATSSWRARVLLDGGVFAYTAGDFAAAPALIDEGLASARVGGDRELVARGLVFQGGVALAAGQVSTAQAALDEALAIARDISHARLEADALHHLGSLTNVRGDPRAARARYTESLELRRQLGIVDEAGMTLMLRAIINVVLHDLPQARVDIAEALRIGFSLRDRRSAWSLDVLACLAAIEGASDRALTLAAAAETMFASTAQQPAAMWRHLVDPYLDRARPGLTDAAARAARERGLHFDFEEALRYALDERTRSAPTTT